MAIRWSRKNRRSRLIVHIAAQSFVTYTSNMHSEPAPQLTLDQTTTTVVKASGAWLAHLLADAQILEQIEAHFRTAHQALEIHWDLTEIVALDHVGAQIFWQAWDKELPLTAKLHPSQVVLFARLTEVSRLSLPKAVKSPRLPFGKVGRLSLNFVLHMLGMLELLGQLVLDMGRFIRHPLRGPWKEISANIYRTGFQALAITALVGMLIGVVLSYLSAQQLRNYGGDLFIVNLLGVSIIRELGPMLAAILIAGRSGSAITAQLGVMRVTEEIDAMRVMGIPIGFRLILPKVVALALTMPMIVIWTDVMALIGGMLSAQYILDMSPAFFIHKLADAVSLANYWIGLGKGVVFGVLIAMVACHYGLRIQPNTESLGQGTTSSVVVSITMVIIADAVFAILFSHVGY